MEPHPKGRQAVIIAALIVLVLAVAAYAFSRFMPESENVSTVDTGSTVPSPTPSSSSVATATPSSASPSVQSSPSATPSASTDPLADWKVYKNTKFNYNFRYPTAYGVPEEAGLGAQKSDELYSAILYLAPESTKRTNEVSSITFNTAESSQLLAGYKSMTLDQFLNEVVSNSTKKETFTTTKGIKGTAVFFGPESNKGGYTIKSSDGGPYDSAVAHDQEMIFFKRGDSFMWISIYVGGPGQSTTIDQIISSLEFTN